MASINSNGLLSKSRLKDKDTAVKVGRRHGKPILYIVKSREMYKEYLTKS